MFGRWRAYDYERLGEKISKRGQGGGDGLLLFLLITHFSSVICFLGWHVYACRMAEVVHFIVAEC
jgi:hypothetical protein